MYTVFRHFVLYGIDHCLFVVYIDDVVIIDSQQCVYYVELY